MNSLQRIAEDITWLAKADYFSPEVRFESVSNGYRTDYLGRLRIRDAQFYFENCIPGVMYGVSTTRVDLDICSNDWLLRVAEETDLRHNLVPLGLLPVALDPGGTALLFDVESGELCYFIAGHIQASSIHTYSVEGGDEKVPLTKRALFEMAEAKYSGFHSFFRHARDATTRARVHAVWRCIDNEDVEYLDHLLSLDLDFRIVNQDGRSPAEEAEHQGKEKLARMIRRQQ